jgi:hypothetical protein
MDDLEERYCTNCRAVLPAKADVCPACGVFAGDIFDGKMPKPKRSWESLITLLLVILIGAGAWWLFSTTNRKAAAPVRHKVVAFVPHPPKSERDAMVAVRGYLTSAGNPTECYALLGKGIRDGAYIIAAVNRCERKAVWQFAVSMKSGAVTKR